jgi:3-oxoacyl-[acyl-carrier protein] reductase
MGTHYNIGIRKKTMKNGIARSSELEGQIALVTGGSGDIGAATVIALARRGADVVVHYHSNRERADEVGQVVESLGRRSMISQADLTKREDIDQLVERARQLGEISILVNNAGTPLRRVSWLELAPDFMDMVFDLNFRAPLYLMQHLVPGMLTKARGVIINVLSVAIYFGGTDTVLAYGAAKGALSTLTRGLARSLAPKGIRVLAVAPGMIDTNIQRNLTGPKIWAELLRDIPLGRIGQPNEIGEVIGFLATNHASFIVGATVDVNGGAYML